MSKLNIMSLEIFASSVKSGWWSDREMNLEHGKEKVTLVACKIALIHSEVSEALEGIRKNINDDHLPHRPMIEVELADTLIRIFDLAGYLDLDLDGAIKEKLEYNKQRLDHKQETRDAVGGKLI